MHHDVRVIEAVCEELLICVDLQRTRHMPIVIGKHPIDRHDGVALDMKRLRQLISHKLFRTGLGSRVKLSL